jgi:hypothetical protein
MRSKVTVELAEIGNVPAGEQGHVAAAEEKEAA